MDGVFIVQSRCPLPSVSTCRSGGAEFQQQQESCAERRQVGAPRSSAGRPIPFGCAACTSVLDVPVADGAVANGVVAPTFAEELARQRQFPQGCKSFRRTVFELRATLPTPYVVRPAAGHDARKHASTCAALGTELVDDTCLLHCDEALKSFLKNDASDGASAADVDRCWHRHAEVWYDAEIQAAKVAKV